MSLSLPQLLDCLAAGMANEVAPALQLHGTPGAPDPGYAGGSAATTALLLMLAASEARQAGARDAAANVAAQAELGPAAAGRDLRAAAWGDRLLAAEMAGDGLAAREVLACLAAEAANEWASLVAGVGLPPPVPIAE